MSVVKHEAVKSKGKAEFNVLLSKASNWMQKRFANAYKHFSTEIGKVGILQETPSMFKGRQEVNS